MAARVATMLPKLVTLNMHICKYVHVYVFSIYIFIQYTCSYLFAKNIFIFMQIWHMSSEIETCLVSLHLRSLLFFNESVE